VWKQGLFVLLAIAVAIVANWFRAFGIVMIAHLSDMKLALGVDHYLYGWVFFGIIIFLLMSVGGLWRDEDAALSPSPATLPAASPWRCSTGKLALLLATLLIWPLLLQQFAQIQAHPLARSVPETRLPQPAGAAFEVAGWTPHYVGNPEQDSGVVAVGSTRCGWQLAWYPHQRPGSEIIAAGNRLVQEKLDPWRVLSLAVATTTVAAVPAVKQTVLQERAGERVTLVWQWYWVDGSVTSNPLITQWLGLRGRLRGHGNAGASVLVYQLLDDAAQVPAAIPTANACVAQVAPLLQARFAHSLTSARTPP
jgi:EpsI family protein